MWKKLRVLSVNHVNKELKRIWNDICIIKKALIVNGTLKEEDFKYTNPEQKVKLVEAPKEEAPKDEAPKKRGRKPKVEDAQD
jgi:hypothetical protein